MAKHLQIKSKNAGYRRAGRAFHDKEAALVPLEGLSKAHEKALREDPHLLVSEVDVETAGADDAGSDATAGDKKKKGKTE